MKYFTATFMAAVLGILQAGIGCAVTIDTVTIGNANNAADATGYGAVTELYSMGKYEITAGEYCEFLNAVARTDAYGLYNPYMWSNDYGCKIQQSGSSGSFSYSVASDWANRPVNFVSWGDAARFCNWLQNNQPAGAQDLSTTEDGAYYLNGMTSDSQLMSVARNGNAQWWIPSEDQWYKSAYHKNDGATGNYFLYPTGSNIAPSNDLVEPNDPGNNATYWDPSVPDFTIDSPYYRTEKGAHENSDSPYHTFDQGGNVMEWNEAVIIDPYGGGPSRGLRGGAFLNTSSNLAAGDRSYYFPPTIEGTNIGFRVASVPRFDWIGGQSSSPTDWGLASNWDPGTGLPDGSGVKVRFGGQSPDYDLIDMIASGRTVGSIDFAASGTTIQSTGGYDLTLDNNGNDSTIMVEGSHSITAPVILNNDLNQSGSGTLELSGGVSGRFALNVLGGNLSVSSIFVETLSIGPGIKVTIMPIPGGILNESLVTVPEPSIVILLGLGILGLFAYSRLLLNRHQFHKMHDVKR